MSTIPLFDRFDQSAGERLYTVSELTSAIKTTLEEGFARIGVTGEISGYKAAHSGHLYFNLKDDSATIRAVIWKNAARGLVFELSDGLAVRAWGDVTVYAPRGEYQITIRKIEPEGIGALELAFRQIFDRLQREGLFDPARKRPLPVFPRRIMVVTSPTGAAVRDLLQVIGRRWRAVEVLIIPVRVQGDGAAREIADAIALANRVAGADLIIVTRGGGSIEDLWPFNEEIVARAIFASMLPVVSAVGHEVDVTIADHVADLRALTPTDAAVRCVPDSAELGTRVSRLGDRLGRALHSEARHARARLDRLADRLHRSVRDQTRQSRLQLDALSLRAAAAIRLGLDRRAHLLARRGAQLEALSPLAVLARGYSLTLQEDGVTVLRSAAAVRPGQTIHTLLASGRVISRVETTHDSRFP